MFSILRAAVAVTVSLACGAAEARGHHSAPIIVSVPVAARAAYMGVPASIPLVLGPAQAEAGVLTPGATIGVRIARPAEARILVEGIDDKGIIIAPGTALVRVDLDNPLAAPKPDDQPLGSIWCSVREMPGGHGPTQDCLRDSKGSGKFDQFWTGYVSDAAAPFSVVGVSYSRPIPEAAYRSAKPEEAPTTALGYRQCTGQGDGQNIPWRFTTAMRTAKDGWTGWFGACPFGDWPNAADKTVETVDTMKLKLEPGPVARFQVISTLDEGPAAPVKLGEALRRKGAVSVDTERRMEAMASVPLIADGKTEVGSVGPIAHGDTIAKMPVVHGVTGVLKNDVEAPGAFFTKEKMPAGQYVFGIPMNSSSSLGLKQESAVTWCAPQIKDGDPTQISTICFPHVGSTNMWVPVGGALMVTQMYFPATSRQVVGLSIERRPVRFAAPMTLAYVFDHWVPQGLSGGKSAVFAQIGVEIRVNGKMTPIGHLEVVAGPDKVYRLPISGGVFTLAMVDRNGKPVDLPSLALERADLDALFDRLDKNSARLSVQKPPEDHGALPLGGLVLVSANPAAPAATPPTVPAAP